MEHSLFGVLGRYGKWVALFVLLYFPIFLNIDVFPIRIWDESQYALNAYEMLHNGDWLVPTYQGQPDILSLKPSLAPFLQMLCMKVLGAGELAVRLPSAIAALLTCIFIMFVSIRLFGNFWLGFITSLVLVTSSGYISEHVTRTGDADSLLIFFITVFALSFFTACERKNNSNRNIWLHLFFIALIFATLTKGIAAFLILPALLIYSLATGNFIWWFKKAATYLYTFLLIAVNAFYYGWREKHSPGYLQQVVEVDVLGRFSGSIDGHTGGFWYYLNLFDCLQLSPWIYLLPVALIAGLVIYKGVHLRLLIYCALLIATHYIVIASSQSKLNWYASPEYPFIALIIALFISYFYDLLVTFFRQEDRFASRMLPFLLLVMLFQFPYKLIVEKVYDKRENFWDASQMDISYYLKEALKGKKDLTGYKYLSRGYRRDIEFYLNLLRDSGKPITYSDGNALAPGDKVITFQKSTAKVLTENYKTAVVEEFKKTVKVYVVL